MPIFLVLGGVILLASGVRGTQNELFTLLGQEFTGQDGKPGFGATALAVGATASIGYVPALKGVSNWLTAVVFFSLIAANIRANNNPFTRLEQFVVNSGSNSIIGNDGLRGTING